MKKETLIQKLQKQKISPQIIQAFDQVDRGKFVLDEYKEVMYDDSALPIGFGQTISQPSTIAFMLELLELADAQRILEIGCGSGYVLALIDAAIHTDELIGTEIVQPLSLIAQKNIGYKDNIQIIYTPSGIGLPNRKKFDRILVSAAADQVPEQLIPQLNEEGILVCPVKNSIVKIKKKEGNRVSQEEFEGFAFVPLIGYKDEM